MKVVAKEFDQTTGVLTTYGEEDGKFVVKTEQDVEPHLEYSKALQNDDDYKKQGIKNGWQHAAHIPNTVCLKMKMEDGFDAFTAHPDELAAFLNKNRAKYGYLFTTTGKI